MQNLGIQGLRFAAAMLVVTDHSLEYMIRRGVLPKDLYGICWFFGWFGVGIFFILSGYLMIKTTWKDISDESNQRVFFERRFTRIAPLYWLATIIFALISLAKEKTIFFDHFLKSAFFIPYNNGKNFRPIVEQGWTLNYEAFFYLLIFLTIPFGQKKSVLFVSIIIVLLIFSGIDSNFVSRDVDDLTGFVTNPLIFLFVLGMLLVPIEKQNYIDIRSIWLGIAVFLAMALFYGQLDILSFPLDYFTQIILSLLCFLTVMLVLIFHSKNNRPMSFLAKGGDASYSIYLFHPLFLMASLTIWASYPSSLKIWQTYLITSLLFAIFGGYCVHIFIERPLTKFAKSIVSSRAVKVQNIETNF